jgi:hypothetical protein
LSGGRNGGNHSHALGHGHHDANKSGYRSLSFVYRKFGTSGYCLPKSFNSWSTSSWSESYGCTIYYCSSDSQWYYYYPQQTCYLPCEYIADYPPDSDEADTSTDDDETSTDDDEIAPPQSQS